MTHEERLKAFESYKNKHVMIGRKDMVDKIFSVVEDKITIDIIRFTEKQGSPENLKIPDFVEKII